VFDAWIEHFRATGGAGGGQLTQRRVDRADDAGPCMVQVDLRIAFASQPGSIGCQPKPLPGAGRPEARRALGDVQAAFQRAGWVFEEPERDNDHVRTDVDDQPGNVFGERLQFR
jgi:hypothetical protein